MDTKEDGEIWIFDIRDFFGILIKHKENTRQGIKSNATNE
jgi:hypothetical protein